MSALPLPLLRRPRADDGRRVPRAHWHRFRWVGDDAFSGSSLYACRCGVVRPGL